MGPITSMSPKGRVIFATGLTLFVLLFDVLYGANLVQDRRTKNFPATIGTVLGTQLDSEDVSLPDGGTVQYRGLVHYAYAVNGHSYESRQVRVSDTYGSLAWAQAFLSRYRPGQKINVYYDPANPAYAVLLTGLQDDWQALLTLLPVNAGVVAAWIWAVRGFRGMKRRREQERTGTPGV